MANLEVLRSLMQRCGMIMARVDSAPMLEIVPFGISLFGSRDTQGGLEQAESGQMDNVGCSMCSLSCLAGCQQSCQFGCNPGCENSCSLTISSVSLPSPK
jgi:hypothetical protein